MGEHSKLVSCGTSQHGEGTGGGIEDGVKVEAKCSFSKEALSRGVVAVTGPRRRELGTR